MLSPKIKIRGRYDYARVVAPVVGVSKTDPQFLRECDVNVVVNRFRRTGIPPPMMSGRGTYGDFTAFQDFDVMMRKTREGVEMFYQLPSAVRDRFGSSPEAFYRFASDPANADELVKMGLGEYRRPADIPVVRVIGGTDSPALGSGKSVQTT